MSVILRRQLLPTRLYPGRGRGGADLTRLPYRDGVRVCDGVDWFWLPSMLRALALLLRERPDVVILQWWTGAVLHSYLLLALAARLCGGRLVIEFHEVQDTGEARLWPARRYFGLLMPLLLRLADGAVVHSEYDRAAMARSVALAGRPTAVIPHGPFNHYQAAGGEVRRAAPVDCCNLLYFGVIRPYKGLEDLLRAFEAIPEDQIGRYWLTVVGETWEGWTLPEELIAASRYRERITFVNRYVPDEEVAAYFAGADAVVLPYHRSSASGPLHVAVSQGLPVVVTQVGGLVEAVADYAGALPVPPRDPAALGEALRKLPARRGRRFADPHSWDRTVQRLDALFARLGVARQPAAWEEAAA